MRWPKLLIIVLAFAGLAAPVSAAVKVLHSERSLYRNIFVTEDEGLRCLTFRRYIGAHRQTCFRLSDPKELVFDYTKMMLGVLAMTPHPRHILVVGLGGATLPTALREIVPDAVVDVAEIDPAVVKVAETYFNFTPGPMLTVTTEDGRVFVKKQLQKGVKYDLIMLDAFEDDYIPEHLLTREFLTEVKGLLTPDGILAANTFSGTKLYPYESATYASVFGTFYNLVRANRVIWAQLGPLTPKETIAKNAEALAPEFSKRGITTDWLAAMLSTTQDWPADTRVLTDQYSPSNLLNAK